MSWFSHGYHGQWHCSWARTHDEDDDGDGVAQHGGHTPNIRLTETLQPWFTVYFFDIGHPYHVMINWYLSKQAICWSVSRDHVAGSSIQLIEITWFFEVFDQVLVFYWIAGSCQVNLLKTGQDCWEIVRKPVNASLGLKFIRMITFLLYKCFLLLCFEYMVIIKLKTESQTVNKTPRRTVAILKSTFYHFLG